MLVFGMEEEEEDLDVCVLQEGIQQESNNLRNANACEQQQP